MEGEVIEEDTPYSTTYIMHQFESKGLREDLVDCSIDLLEYSGSESNVQWLDDDSRWSLPHGFTTIITTDICAAHLFKKVCRIVGEVDFNPVTTFNTGPNGRYWTAIFRIVVHFGGTELRAHVEWEHVSGWLQTGLSGSLIIYFHVLLAKAGQTKR